MLQLQTSGADSLSHVLQQQHFRPSPPFSCIQRVWIPGFHQAASLKGLALLFNGSLTVNA